MSLPYATMCMVCYIQYKQGLALWVKHRHLINSTVTQRLHQLRLLRGEGGKSIKFVAIYAFIIMIYTVYICICMTWACTMHLCG